MEQRDAYPDRPAFYDAYPGDAVTPHPELAIRPVPHAGELSTAAVLSAFEQALLGATLARRIDRGPA